jgi:CCR4-NOT transcription complex subunit 2
VENAQDELSQKIPQCYLSQHPQNIKLDQFSKFQLESLFYMFYQMPRDVFQALAAQELYKRDWRYHGELKIWLKPRTPQEIMQAHSTVQFFYFDAKTFETRLFNPPNRSNLLAGIIPEEEIRVKVPSSTMSDSA